MNRASQREGIDVPFRLRLIDGDLDENEAAHIQITKVITELEQRITKKVESGFAKCEEDSNANRKLLIGLLSSVVVACVLMVINVIALGGVG